MKNAMPFTKQPLAKNRVYLILFTLVAGVIWMAGCNPFATTPNERQGWAPLHYAADSGDAKKVLELLKRGDDVNVRDSLRRTPLHYAGSSEVAHILLARGAAINAKDAYDATPLLMATERSDGRSDGRSGSHHNVAYTLINKGANVNIQVKNGCSVLYFAVGNLDFIKRLVQEGADVNAGGFDSPLQLSVISGEYETVEYLIARGADFKVKDSEGVTLLHQAAMNSADDPRIIRILLRKGGDINVKDKQSRTPLHYAVSETCLKNVRYLMARRANADIKDIEGKTPLACALETPMPDSPEDKRQHNAMIEALRK
jgi:ankyrin repeat protein